MFFRTERLERILKELKELTYPETISVEELKTKEGYYHSIEEVDNSSKPWKDFKRDDRWGLIDKNSWFRMEFIVPKTMEGKKLIHRVETGNTRWESKNPQFLIFINNELIQGYDINHNETILTERGKTGDRYVIDLQGYSGSEDKLSECKQYIAILDSTIERLFYDIKIPLDVAKTLQKEDKNRLNIMGYLENTINMLDLRKPYTNQFYEGITAATTYLNEQFYDIYCNGDGIAAKCVGHTHIDVAWLWDIAQTRQKVQRSFATVLQLMKEYPEYIFMSSQPQLYQYLKEERPQMYEQIKEKVREGRWEPEGGMWVEADCNLSSGESLIRQIIYGKRFFREEFGVENKILWLPDVFGYSAALPQILKKSGIDYFMTTKISWNEYNKLPYDTLQWVGLDGSQVLTHFITTVKFDDLPNRHDTTYNGFIDVPSVKGAWERYQQKALNDEVLISFGYGDGGGGPTKEMLETARRLEKGIPGCPVVKIGTSNEFFEDLENTVNNHPKLPKWVGELYLEYHRGTLTSMARNKRYNRKSEILYGEIEWLSTMNSQLSNGKYPKEDLGNSWKIICLNQFHDIIPGSSIKKVYEDSMKQYEDILKNGRRLKEEAINSITALIGVDEPSVMVLNSLSFERDEIVEYEIDGVIKTFYAKDIPPKGYRLYPIRTIVEETKLMTITTRNLENRFFEIHLDTNSNIVSIYDKIADREVLAEGKRANVLQAFEDKPHNFDAWDINIYYQEKMWEINDLQSVKIVEDGSLKATLEIKRKFMDSTITQLMSIYRDTPRIDFDTTIDWKEKQILVKAAFPVDIHAEKATYDIQFGNVERPTHWNTRWDMAKFEVCGHKWADLSEGDYGVSLLNDCKYGYDIKDDTMRLTLIKSAISPNEDADREMHRFTYSLYPHIGDWRKAGTVQMGYKLNCPVTSLVVNKQTGNLPEVLSFASIDSENVIMEVIKQAEATEDIILRVHECYNKRSKARITLFRDIKTVFECDLEERHKLEKIETEGRSFEFIIKPYEIKTFKLTF